MNECNKMWKELHKIFKEDWVADKTMTAKINKVFRKYDESNLWTVCGKFNVTERAIRRLRKWRRDGLDVNTGLEYALCLESEISRIVNNQI